jgi:hypothetical protein
MTNKEFKSWFESVNKGTDLVTMRKEYKSYIAKIRETSSIINSRVLQLEKSSLSAPQCNKVLFELGFRSFWYFATMPIVNADGNNDVQEVEVTYTKTVGRKKMEMTRISRRSSRLATLQEFRSNVRKHFSNFFADSVTYIKTDADELVTKYVRRYLSDVDEFDGWDDMLLQLGRLLDKKGFVFSSATIAEKAITAKVNLTKSKEVRVNKSLANKNARY